MAAGTLDEEGDEDKKGAPRMAHGVLTNRA